MRLRCIVRRLGRLIPARQSPRRVAVCVSAHGFGHAVRAAAVLERLHEIVPIRISVTAGCNRRIWPPSLAPLTESWTDGACDVGVVQSDDVTVDLAATGRSVDRWLRDLPDIVDREERRLRGAFDLLLGDVPSPVFEAAYRVGIPSVALANFTWDWIYAELGLGAAAAAASEAYAKATLLLEATPCAPMAAFGRRLGVGLVTRPPSRERDASRVGLGLGSGESAVLLAFQPASAPSVALPPRRAGRVYLVPQGWPAAGQRGDVRELPQTLRFEDALAAADVVVGKPGYGLIGDVEAAGARFLYVPRPGFPENAVLEEHLDARAATVALAANRLAAGAWEDALDAVEHTATPSPAEAGGALRAAQAIAELLAVDSGAGAE